MKILNLIYIALATAAMVVGGVLSIVLGTYVAVPDLWVPVFIREAIFIFAGWLVGCSANFFLLKRSMGLGFHQFRPLLIFYVVCFVCGILYAWIAAPEGLKLIGLLGVLLFCGWLVARRVAKVKNGEAAP